MVELAGRLALLWAPSAPPKQLATPDGSTCGAGALMLTDGIGINDLVSSIDDEIAVLTTVGRCGGSLADSSIRPLTCHSSFSSICSISRDGESVERAYVGTDGSTYPLTFDADATEGLGTSGFCCWSGRCWTSRISRRSISRRSCLI